MNAIINIQDFVQVKNSQTVTTSEFIAQAFKKQHGHVMRNIDELLADIDPTFAAQNFRETETLRDNPLTGGKTKSRAYELTKDGFMLLVMGFTGKAALAIKIAYIQAFNKMAEMLSGFHLQAQTTVDERKPLREAVFALAAQYGLTYSTAYKMVHQRFNVESIDMLPSKSPPPWRMCIILPCMAKYWISSLKSHSAKANCANWQRLLTTAHGQTIYCANLPSL